MSREDTDKEHDYGNVEVAELGVDHNGNKQWFASTREGWDETGTDDGNLILSKENNPVGTRVELSIPIEH